MSFLQDKKINIVLFTLNSKFDSISFIQELIFLTSMLVKTFNSIRLPFEVGHYMTFIM